MLVTAYIARMTLTGYRPRTIQERARALRAFSTFLEPRQLSEATRLDCEAFLARPLAAESRRAYRSHLRAFYAWCVDETYLSADPMEKVPAIRVRRGVPRPIGDADLARAMHQAGGRMGAWLLLMSLGGLRAMEVAGLRPADVMLSDTGALLFLREGKGGASATVPAHPAILAALSLLPIRDGMWWECNPATVSRAVAAHLRASGVEATGHQLRHFAGTSWYRASGHDLLTTAALLRHQNVSTTQVYSQLDPAGPSRVVNLVALPRVS